jgi:hypothetical protein
MPRDINKEVEIAVTWIETPPPILRNRKEYEIAHHAYMLLQYRGIHPGWTETERVNAPRIRQLMEEYNRNRR